MTTDPIYAVINSIRQQVDELERLLFEERGSDNADLPVFDPDYDEPVVQPLASGSASQRDWCGLMLWVQLVRLNLRTRRGATPEQSVAIAKRAGYRDGRGWNKWADCTEKDDEGDMWAAGPVATHLRNYYAAVGRQMPGDIEHWCAHI